MHLFLQLFFKHQREIDVKEGKFTPLKDSWFELETKETNGDTKVLKVRLKADEKMYDQWKTKLENAIKMKEEKPKFSSDDDSDRKEPFRNYFCYHNCQLILLLAESDRPDPMEVYGPASYGDEYYGENSQRKPKPGSDSSFDYDDHSGTLCMSNYSHIITDF